MLGLQCCVALPCATCRRSAPAQKPCSGFTSTKKTAAFKPGSQLHQSSSTHPGDTPQASGPEPSSTHRRKRGRGEDESHRKKPKVQQPNQDMVGKLRSAAPVEASPTPPPVAEEDRPAGEQQLPGLAPCITHSIQADQSWWAGSVGLLRSRPWDVMGLCPISRSLQGADAGLVSCRRLAQVPVFVLGFMGAVSRCLPQVSLLHLGCDAVYTASQVTQDIAGWVQFWSDT